jgi:hypothetical protein
MSRTDQSLASSRTLNLALTALALALTLVEPTTVMAGGPEVALDSDSLLVYGQGEPTAIVVIAPEVGAGYGPFAEEPALPAGLLWVGPRYGIGGESPLGEEQKENFTLYDIAALWRLPWGWRSRHSNWGLETRRIGSAGELAAAGTTSFMATLVPALAVSDKNGVVSLDLGLGFGFFSNYKFGVQDFGGPVQIVGSTGIGFTPFPGFRAGYRFQHFSDAGTYGPTSLRVDMHLIELGCVLIRGVNHPFVGESSGQPRLSPQTEKRLPARFLDLIRTYIAAKLGICPLIQLTMSWHKGWSLYTHCLAT